MDPCSHILLYLYFPPLHLLTLAGIRAVVRNHINDTFDGEGVPRTPDRPLRLCSGPSNDLRYRTYVPLS